MWLILVAAGFPALGAAVASINNQGEFARLQRRSQAMVAGFVDLRAKVAHLAARPTVPPLIEVTDIAAEIATMMLDENTEWRIVVCGIFRIRRGLSQLTRLDHNAVRPRNPLASRYSSELSGRLALGLTCRTSAKFDLRVASKLLVSPP